MSCWGREMAKLSYFSLFPLPSSHPSRALKNMAPSRVLVYAWLQQRWSITGARREIELKSALRARSLRELRPILLDSDRGSKPAVFSCKLFTVIVFCSSMESSILENMYGVGVTLKLWEQSCKEHQNSSPCCRFSHRILWKNLTW